MLLLDDNRLLRDSLEEVQEGTSILVARLPAQDRIEELLRRQEQQGLAERSGDTDDERFSEAAPRLVEGFRCAS